MAFFAHLIQIIAYGFIILFISLMIPLIYRIFKAYGKQREEEPTYFPTQKTKIKGIFFFTCSVLIMLGPIVASVIQLFD